MHTIGKEKERKEKTAFQLRNKKTGGDSEMQNEKNSRSEKKRKKKREIIRNRQTAYSFSPSAALRLRSGFKW